MNLYSEKLANPGKPDLVLLHGWGMNSTIWQGLVNVLSDDYSLTLIDLPGLGRSVDYPEPYTAAAVVELLAEHAPQKAIWLGWSMGGQLAVQFASRFPDRVEKLVTVASNPCFVRRTDWPCAMDEATYSAFVNSLQTNVPKTLMRFAMLQTQGAEGGRETLKQLKAALQVAQPSAPLVSLGLLRDDARPMLQNLNMPLLQLFGEKDLLVPVAAAQACTEITGQNTIVYPGAGHLPFISHQARFVSDLQTFLQEASV
ncbi:MAG: pimeloyl-[acyl-carrier protein] methyl ester esterase [Neptuniibacter caesariensis]|uniref:Pimeloyl-[acyl-carrier protein] methyl ester esterase n=1 Tax=Neptuniibacter caesariensis TaxID=207954 RepID=A0A2G6JNB5_NEPCE|nr:MAG: pimeloyl-[acyl-carrier protein] methyl ester esterase [Neptuniibacter caesariensis]